MKNEKKKIGEESYRLHEKFESGDEPKYRISMEQSDTIEKKNTMEKLQEYPAAPQMKGSIKGSFNFVKAIFKEGRGKKK